MRILFTFGLLFAFAPIMVARGQGPWFPVLDNQAAWEHLPKTISGQRDDILPVWARILARPLPSTTAAMLEMDRVQRVENPLEAQLRAKIRWVAAQANGSRYAAACAEGDLVRAGGNADDLQEIRSSPERLSDKERRVFDFARLLCEAAYEVTDDEVATLLVDWGPADLSAIVLTVAYANFQDRLLLAMGIDAETGDMLPPPNVYFDWEDLKEHPLTIPPRVLPEPPSDAATVATRVDDVDWQSAPLEELQSRLKEQQTRGPRIPIPPDDLVERQTTPGIYPPGRAALIRWNAVTYGYQPELTHAWFFAMRRFREEAGLPADFRQSAFWVVTRSNMCFY